MAIPNGNPKEVNPIFYRSEGKKIRKEISPGEKVISATRQPSTKKAAREAAEKTAREAAEKTAKEATEKLMKMGKVGTTVGIGAAIIAGLSKNKGRQSNPQLYGQKGY